MKESGVQENKIPEIKAGSHVGIFLHVHLSQYIKGYPVEAMANTPGAIITLFNRVAAQLQITPIVGITVHGADENALRDFAVRFSFSNERNFIPFYCYELYVVPDSREQLNDTLGRFIKRQGGNHLLCMFPDVLDLRMFTNGGFVTVSHLAEIQNHTGCLISMPHPSVTENSVVSFSIHDIEYLLRAGIRINVIEVPQERFQNDLYYDRLNAISRHYEIPLMTASDSHSPAHIVLQNDTVSSYVDVSSFPTSTIDGISAIRKVIESPSNIYKNVVSINIPEVSYSSIIRRWRFGSPLYYLDLMRHREDFDPGAVIYYVKELVRRLTKASLRRLHIIK